MKPYIFFLFIFFIPQLAISQKRVVIPDRSDTFTDTRDDRSYTWVEIGSQTWMAENLNYKTSRESWCYENVDINCEKYGRLYTWEEALDACPSGWHLPTDQEWKILEMDLGMSLEMADRQGVRGIEGGKLKEDGTIHWENPNMGASNQAGFFALPGGIRGKTGMFYELGRQSCFWTATSQDFYKPEVHSSSFAWGRILFYNSSRINRHDRISKKKGLSVRCVKDKIPSL